MPTFPRLSDYLISYLNILFNLFINTAEVSDSNNKIENSW